MISHESFLSALEGISSIGENTQQKLDEEKLKAKHNGYRMVYKQVQFPLMEALFNHMTAI